MYKIGTVVELVNHLQDDKYTSKKGIFLSDCTLFYDDGNESWTSIQFEPIGENQMIYYYRFCSLRSWLKPCELKYEI